MTDHPAKDCTEAQRCVFEQIATGNRHGHPVKVLQALLEKGLIVNATARPPGDHEERPITPLLVFDPVVPIQHHHQFCSWASEQDFTEEDLT